MEIIIVLVSGITLILMVLVYRKLGKSSSGDEFSKVLRSELKESREDLSKGLKENREELNNSISTFQKSFLESLQKLQLDDSGDTATATGIMKDAEGMYNLGVKWAFTFEKS